MHKLLVVDDENDICDFVKTFFKDRGFHVLTASNGEEALSIVKKDRPDMVLLDIKMKGMDGLAALKHIKRAFFNGEFDILHVAIMTLKPCSDAV